jgi:hypothetical protein
MGWDREQETGFANAAKVEDRDDDEDDDANRNRVQ